MRDTQKDFYKKLFGENGENLAKKYLKKLKYKILKTNFYCNLGEIDIIAKDKDYIVFVEVKSRTGDGYGSPAEAVTKTKQRHIINTARYYLHINHLEDEFCRFDVIEVLNDEINHIKDAFIL